MKREVRNVLILEAREVDASTNPSAYGVLEWAREGIQGCVSQTQALPGALPLQ
jgi:hypothetical protein